MLGTYVAKFRKPLPLSSTRGPKLPGSVTFGSLARSWNEGNGRLLAEPACDMMFERRVRLSSWLYQPIPFQIFPKVNSFTIVGVMVYVRPIAIPWPGLLKSTEYGTKLFEASLTGIPHVPLGPQSLS